MVLTLRALCELLAMPASPSAEAEPLELGSEEAALATMPGMLIVVAALEALALLIEAALELLGAVVCLGLEPVGEPALSLEARSMVGELAAVAAPLPIIFELVRAALLKLLLL